MIRTVVVPQNNQVFVAIPNSYIGKEIEIFLYAIDELNEVDTKAVEPTQKKGLARFRGILTNDEAQKLQDYVQNSRTEWK
jgi:hypothetical protein